VAARFAGSRRYSKIVRVVYNGVDTAVFTPLVSGDQFRKTHNIPSAIPLIGYCGQLAEAKGLAVLIEAFRIIKIAIPESKLVLAGRGDFKSALRVKINGLKLEDSVLFVGFLEDISRFMAALDIFVLPSFWLEGLSRVLLESMACGKPVVATPAGGNSETVVDGQTGYFFPSGSSAVLAEKVISLLENKSLAREFGENGRKRVLELFSIQKTAEGIHKVYEELLRG